MTRMALPKGSKREVREAKKRPTALRNGALLVFFVLARCCVLRASKYVTSKYRLQCDQEMNKYAK